MRTLEVTSLDKYDGLSAVANFATLLSTYLEGFAVITEPHGSVISGISEPLLQVYSLPLPSPTQFFVDVFCTTECIFLSIRFPFLRYPLELSSLPSPLITTPHHTLFNPFVLSPFLPRLPLRRYPLVFSYVVSMHPSLLNRCWNDFNR